MANVEDSASGSLSLRGGLLFCLLAYMSFCAFLALRSLKRVKPYTNWDVLTAEEKIKFAGYERNDRHRLSYVRTGLGGFFLLPWRMIVAFSLVISNGLTSWLLFRVLGADGQAGPARERTARKLIGYFAHLHCRFLLYIMGIYRIKEVYLGNKQDLTKKPKDQPRVLVSNHVSCLDIPYFISSCFASFVAKKSLSVAPFIGIAANSLGCIYVERESAEDRRLALEKIRKRQLDCAKDPEQNPLVIFPEGTTTNGRGLLQFRRGGFSSFCRVQPVLLVYQSSYVDLGFDMLPSFDWMVQTLSSSGLTTLHAYWLEPIDPPPAEKFQTDEERANAFAEIVRNRMWEELKKRNSLTPQIAGPCPTCWLGSVSVRREIVQTLMQRQGLSWKQE
uniref:Acyltransferase domain-containing protein n=1 Tax=Toxoplasma gondii COUG TaxID=1074873 RepID=A0A2G8Y975_TOXGO|nr:acyltransferase domain-containing protein [Toxoplasma gondii COUG]